MAMVTCLIVASCSYHDPDVEYYNRLGKAKKDRDDCLHQALSKFEDCIYGDDKQAEEEVGLPDFCYTRKAHCDQCRLNYRLDWWNCAGPSDGQIDQEHGATYGEPWW
jgi:hypothetical protein